jgi:hypothetical protein
MVLIATSFGNRASAELQPIENSSLFLNYFNNTTGLSIKVPNWEVADKRDNRTLLIYGKDIACVEITVTDDVSESLNLPSSLNYATPSDIDFLKTIAMREMKDLGVGEPIDSYIKVGNQHGHKVILYNCSYIGKSTGKKYMFTGFIFLEKNRIHTITSQCEELWANIVYPTYLIPFGYSVNFLW